MLREVTGMKSALVLIGMAFSIVLLSSCAPCGYPTDCWKGYFVDSKCGTYVVSPCRKLCMTCTYNEPECKACWECVKNDGCGYGRIGMCGPRRGN